MNMVTLSILREQFIHSRRVLLRFIPLSWQQKYKQFFHYELQTVPNGGFVGGIVIFATFMVYGSK